MPWIFNLFEILHRKAWKGGFVFVRSFPEIGTPTSDCFCVGEWVGGGRGAVRSASEG